MKTSAPTTPANLKKIDQMFQAMEPLLTNLYCRWQDEKDYEDIQDYLGAIRKNLPKGFDAFGMSRKPFGFYFSIGTDAEYFMSCNSRQVSWKRTA